MLFSAFELQIIFAKTILLTTNSGTATTALIWPTHGTTALVGIPELIVDEFLSCQGFWGLQVNIYFVRGCRFRPMRNTIAAKINHSRAFWGGENKNLSISGMCSMSCNWDTEEWFVFLSPQDLFWPLARCIGATWGWTPTGAGSATTARTSTLVKSPLSFLDSYFDEILSQAAALPWLRGVPWRSWERLRPRLTGLPLDRGSVPLDRGTPLALALTRRYVGTKCSSWFVFFCWTRKQ